jgi:periplasmic protein TonB
MFRGTLLDSSPNQGTWLAPSARRLVALAGLVAFASGAEILPRLSWFRSPWSWFEGGVAAAFVAMFYVLMSAFVAADSRRTGMRARTWLAVVLVANVAGLVCYLVASARRTGDWKRIAVPLAYVFEALLLGVCVTLPLISTAALPTIGWLTPVPPLAAGKQAPTAARELRPLRRPLADRTLRAPTIIPRLITKVETTPEPAQLGSARMVGPGVPNGVPGSNFTNLFGETPVIPESPPRPNVGAEKRLVVSSGVEAAKLIYGPRPEYPPLAIVTRTEGTVLLKAIIGRDGTIQELKVLGGHPLLVRAAVEAVEHWRYSPTLLDREPVEVETEIEMRFKLSE